MLLSLFFARRSPDFCESGMSKQYDVTVILDGSVNRRRDAGQQSQIRNNTLFVPFGCKSDNESQVLLNH